jgi:hypothetical protein
MKAFNVSLFLLILVVAFASPQGSGFAQSGDELTQSTAHYRITLAIGPVAMLLRPDQVSRATEGEVPLAMPRMPRPPVAMPDRGRPETRHIEVAVYDKATGARLRRAMPRIAITDRKTGRATALPAVVAMSDGTEGQGDLHFGENVPLANGTYRIVVSVGGERAVFKKVAVGRP